MDQNSEHLNDKFSISSKMFRFKSWYLEVGAILLIIICSKIGLINPFVLLFLLAYAAAQYPALYLLSAALLFVFSIIGILKSDKNDNAKLFYGSALLFCLSIIMGILYFILPVISIWLFMGD